MGFYIILLRVSKKTTTTQTRPQQPRTEYKVFAVEYLVYGRYRPYYKVFAVEYLVYGRFPAGICNNFTPNQTPHQSLTSLTVDMAGQESWINDLSAGLYVDMNFCTTTACTLAALFKGICYPEVCILNIQSIMCLL
jgi:hypothetical protein